MKSAETTHKSKKKIIIIACSAILILFIALLLLYFRPVYLKFQVPDSQPQDLAVYISSTNTSGGITADKHQLSVEEFSKIIEILDKTPLQRTIPLNESSLSSYAPFDLKASYTADEPESTYLSELRLYSKDKDNYVIAYLGENEQTYRIADGKAAEKLINLLNRLT